MIRLQNTAYQIGKIKFLLESKFNFYSPQLDTYKIKNAGDVKYDFRISVYRSKSKIGRKRKWVVNKSPYHYSVVYPDLYLAEIILTTDKDIFSLPFSSVLSTIFPSLYNGMILHGSCVTKQNNAYLFLGKSGAGKSTIAELAGEYGSYKIIADDLVLIRNINNDFYAFSIPQSKEKQAELKGARVKKIFFIKQSGKNMVKKIEFKNALRQILTNTPFTKCFTPAINQRIFCIINSLLKSKLPYEFEFLKSPSAVRLIDEN